MGIHQKSYINRFDILFFNLSQFKKYGILQFNSFAYGLRRSTKSRDLVQTYSCVVWIGWSGLGLLDSTVFSDSLYSWSWFGFCSYVNRSSMADVQTETIELAKNQDQKMTVANPNPRRKNPSC